MDGTVDTTVVAGVVVIIGALPNGVDVDMLGVIVTVEGTVELVTAVVRLVDGTEAKG